MDFSEIFEDKTKYGTKLKTDEYEEQGKYLIVDQGQELIADIQIKKKDFFGAAGNYFWRSYENT